MNELTYIDPECKRTDWPSGEWDREPDKVQWTDEETGLNCLATRHPEIGYWCGYVGVPDGHPWYGKSFSDIPNEGHDVHGGLTYSSTYNEPIADTPSLWWIGFHCANWLDRWPCRKVDDNRAYRNLDFVYRNLDFVRAEVRKLAQKVKEAA